MRIFLSALLVAAASAANLLPPEIELCHRSDPKFNDCMATNTEKGLQLLSKGYKPLGLTPFEPLNVEKIQINGARTGSVTLNQLYRNVIIYNSTFVKIHEMKVDLEKCEINIKMLTYISIMKADYEIKGQLLLFPINSNGKCTVTLKEITTMHNMKCERRKKNGKTYLNIINYQVNMEPKYVEYDYDNVFPGNEQVEKEIIKTINENSISIFNDVKSGFEEVFSTLYKSLVNRIFSKISEEELFLP